MRICFAVEKDAGVDSEVCSHFHSAQMFLIYDIETESTSTVNNEDFGHLHGACDPFKAIGGQPVDAVVVGGIGSRALSELAVKDIKVYAAAGRTVSQNLRLVDQDKLPLMTLRHACCGFGPPGGCRRYLEGVCGQKNTGDLGCCP